MYINPFEASIRGNSIIILHESAVLVPSIWTKFQSKIWRIAQLAAPSMERVPSHNGAAITPLVRIQAFQSLPTESARIDYSQCLDERRKWFDLNPEVGVDLWEGVCSASAGWLPQYESSRFAYFSEDD